jgi:hypothetical protein
MLYMSLFYVLSDWKCLVFIVTTIFYNKGLTCNVNETHELMPIVV